MSDGVQLIDAEDPLSTVTENGLRDERIRRFSPHGESKIVGLSEQFGMTSVDDPRHQTGQQFVFVEVTIVLVDRIHGVDREKIEVMPFAVPMA